MAQRPRAFIVRRFWLISVVAGPFVLAWMLTGNLCGQWWPSTTVCMHASDMFWDVFIAFSIMFCIAIWVGAGMCYALLKLRHIERGEK